MDKGLVYQTAFNYQCKWVKMTLILWPREFFSSLPPHFIFHSFCSSARSVAPSPFFPWFMKSWCKLLCLTDEWHNRIFWSPTRGGTIWVVWVFLRKCFWKFIIIYYETTKCNFFQRVPFWRNFREQIVRNISSLRVFTVHTPPAAGNPPPSPQKNLETKKRPSHAGWFLISVCVYFCPGGRRYCFQFLLGLHCSKPTTWAALVKGIAQQLFSQWRLSSLYIIFSIFSLKEIL